MGEIRANPETPKARGRKWQARQVYSHLRNRQVLRQAAMPVDPCRTGFSRSAWQRGNRLKNGHWKPPEDAYKPAPTSGVPKYHPDGAGRKSQLRCRKIKNKEWEPCRLSHSICFWLAVYLLHPIPYHCLRQRTPNKSIKAFTAGSGVSFEYLPVTFWKSDQDFIISLIFISFYAFVAVSSHFHHPGYYTTITYR